ncbi:copper amine oxidase [Fictibacillus barbaricus]|uniref:Copper amine oxidase n=1 Tax=Fictibacillus barbaricus TaxID=182136 RepID=A0ABU1TVJ5_9BACL|nr:copper amine oxidase [Fictibacillus barbaricus]MDR7071225.1 hypothetical protein [Fictibacillus barbaricus]
MIGLQNSQTSWKKWMVSVPLGLSLAISSAAGVSAHGNEHHTAKPMVDTPAVELRSTLDQLLSEHAYLAVVAMRKGVDGKADFDAAAGALNKNTEDLSAAIGSVYGDEAGAQFKKMWGDHIGFFVEYFQATAKKDEAGKKAALDKLNNYRADFSKFLETATGERLEAGALAEGLQMHVNQLIGAFDAYVAGDYAKAYEYEHEATSHMYMVSKGLSSAISDQFKDKFENSKAVTPAADLRSNLNQLMTEHASLAVLAMQNGIDGSPDFEASAASLNENTEALSKAIGSIYGEEAGAQFKEMWSAHIGNFVDYVKATGAKDETKKEEAQKALDSYRAEFSKFIETATEGRVKADGLSQGLQEHVNQLTASFDAYAAKDYDTAYEKAREAYAHMLMPAKGLSGAFVDQFPDKFQENMPSDMPKTGMGGMSHENGMAEQWMLLGLLPAAALVMYMARRKMAENK